ncbi:MAG: hypothetical protein C0469_07990 [Cyanobacteria bacterium DS2.3.42]|nr:hypothetical protein [Cyanobacteria bacterium DS2.3.42]
MFGWCLKSVPVPKRALEWGSFGENLTTSGLDENSVCIGDKLKIGTANFIVTQPRMPCSKLGIRLGDSGMVRRFYKSGKWGFYLASIGHYLQAMPSIFLLLWCKHSHRDL